MLDIRHQRTRSWCNWSSWRTSSKASLLPKCSSARTLLPPCSLVYLFRPCSCSFEEALAWCWAAYRQVKGESFLFCKNPAHPPLLMAQVPALEFGGLPALQGGTCLALCVNHCKKKGARGVGRVSWLRNGPLPSPTPVPPNGGGVCSV